MSNDVMNQFKEPKPRKPFKYTPKRMLVSRYRQILGATHIIQNGLNNASFYFPGEKENTVDPKIFAAYSLAHKQLTKLQRDIRELFKVAGLKIK